MAICTSTDSKGTVVRHILGAKGEMPVCALGHDEHGAPVKVRNTPKLRLTSERCARCFREYTAAEKKAGTFEHKVSEHESERLKRAIRSLTPQERAALHVSRYARRWGVTAADVKAALREIKAERDKAQAQARKSAKVSGAAKRARTPKSAPAAAEAPAEEAAAEAAAALVS